MTAVLPDDLRAAGARAGELLRARGETVAVAEGSCGGLVSAALLAVPGASAYYRGGALIYTGAAVRGLLGSSEVPLPDPVRGASEPFVTYLARAIRSSLRADWGVGEGGATGPSGNPYGDPAGHCWMAVDGPVARTRHLLTGDSDREANMAAFAVAALGLLAECLGD